MFLSSDKSVFSFGIKPRTRLIKGPIVPRYGAMDLANEVRVFSKFELAIASTIDLPRSIPSLIFDTSDVVRPWHNELDVTRATHAINVVVHLMRPEKI